MDIFLNKMIQFYLNNTINIRLFNSNQYVVLYPQNGDRIVTTDSDVISPYICMAAYSSFPETHDLVTVNFRPCGNRSEWNEQTLLSQLVRVPNTDTQLQLFKRLYHKNYAVYFVEILQWTFNK